MKKTPALMSAVLMALAVVSQAGETPALEQAASDIQAAAVTGLWVDTDCKDFVFGEDSPALSQAQDFRSETWLEECDNIPLPNPPGGGICIPRRRMLRADIRTVKIQVQGRSAPGPKEVFQVCLWGASLSLKVKQSPNKYSVAEKTEPVFNSTLVLTRK